MDLRDVTLRDYQHQSVSGHLGSDVHKRSARRPEAKMIHWEGFNVRKHSTVLSLCQTVMSKKAQVEVKIL